MIVDEFDVVLYVVQWVFIDVIVQFYFYIYFIIFELWVQVVELIGNFYINIVFEVFIVCFDICWVGKILEVVGYELGSWFVIVVYFGIGDIVMFGQNLLIVVEMFGYQGCWIGGVVNNMDVLIMLFGFFEGVLFFVVIIVGCFVEDVLLCLCLL